MRCDSAFVFFRRWYQRVRRKKLVNPERKQHPKTRDVLERDNSRFDCTASLYIYMCVTSKRWGVYVWVQQDTGTCKRDSGHTLGTRIDTRGSFHEYEPREGRDEKRKKSSPSRANLLPHPPENFPYSPKIPEWHKDFEEIRTSNFFDLCSRTNSSSLSSKSFRFDEAGFAKRELEISLSEISVSCKIILRNHIAFFFGGDITNRFPITAR